MKALVTLLGSILIGYVVYVLFSKKTNNKQEQMKNNWKPLYIALGVTLILLGLSGYAMYQAAIAPDTQCLFTHTTTSRPPRQLVTAQDFLAVGDYYYNSGKCEDAIAAYTEAIQVNQNFPQAYNNRAYTNMRLHNYPAALVDLNKAIALNPNYVTALMNRGDIYNYDYAINRQKAIADYKRVIALGVQKDQSGSVCGHLAMAQTNGMIPLAILKTFTNISCTWYGK